MLNTQTPGPEADDNRFRLAMSSSGIGMAIVDLQGQWLEVNPAMERMFGYAASELVGTSADALTHPDDRGISRGYLQQLAAGELPMIDAQKRYLHRQGSVVWAHVNVAAMRDADGRPCYLIAQLRDITGERAAQEQLRSWGSDLETRVGERTAELERINRDQDLFAYGVSHDLRAPLRAIDGFAKALDTQYGDRLDETGRDYVGRIRKATGRMSLLIDSLLELSRASRAELKSTHVDLSLLADWVGAELQDAEPDRDAAIIVQPDIHVFGDERYLKLLLVQLLQNAWKFSRDCEQVEIRVDAVQQGDRVVISVHDSGCGFDMRYADRLFEPFHRLHGAEQASGHGLGLAIAQRIVERHGGRMWAESQPGGGSRFHVDLAAAPEPPDGAEDRSTA